MKIKIKMKVFIISICLFMVAYLHSQSYIKIDNNNVYIYENKSTFSDKGNLAKDELVYTYPRNTIIHAESAAQAAKNMISLISDAKLVLDIIRNSSSLLIKEMVTFGCPGFASVSFGHTEEQGWGLYLKLENKIFYTWWQEFYYNMAPQDRMIYYLEAEPAIQKYKPSPYDF